MDDSHDKSGDLRDDIDAEPVDPRVESILLRLRKVAWCFRINAYPEMQLVLNQSDNASSVWQYGSQADEQPSGDSIWHTVVILAIFCSVVLLLVVRSSRGGSWTSCKADIAAISHQGQQQSRTDTKVAVKLTELERMHIERVPSWTQERPSFSSTVRVCEETDF